MVSFIGFSSIIFFKKRAALTKGFCYPHAVSFIKLSYSFTSYLASKMLAASVLRVPNRTDLIYRNNILGMPTAGLPLLVADETALRPPRWVRNPDVKLTKFNYYAMCHIPCTIHCSIHHLICVTYLVLCTIL